MPFSTLKPQDAVELLERGALLVDIRSSDEYARRHIAQAKHIPMEQLVSQHPLLEGAQMVIFHCRSGNRTQLNGPALAACVAGRAYVLQGGLDAWEQAGLPLVVDNQQPLELSRQVQIAAGSVVLLGYLLGTLVAPAFHLVSGVVGAGLVFAGLSGFCGLARVLMKMPWNRPRGE